MRHTKSFWLHPLRTFCLLLLLSGTFITPTWAQNITGSISGTVKDPTGAVVSNATVSVVNTDTGVTVRTVKTDSAGNYSAQLLPIGHYQITIEAPVFSKSVQKGI